MKTRVVHFMCFALTILLGALIMIPTTLTAQVAIGDSLKTAHPSAELEVFSESKGFLPPRLTTAQRDSIASPADGLIVFDTDLNKLLYHHNGWKDFGLWSTRDTTSGNIFYNGGRVAIGPGSDTINPHATLNITGSAGIVTEIVADTAREALSAFIAQLDHAGDYNGHLVITTTQTNNTEGGTGGMFSYLESDARGSLAMGGQSFYTGAGGDLDNFEEIPIVMGSMTDAYVLDTLAEVLAIGSNSISESAHKGINIGNYSSAVSPATYGNIGVLAEAGDSSANPIIFVRDSFPTRFTAAALLLNSSNTANDFNVYAAGEAQSYFGGNVGIGTITPTTKLDVAGTVNAEVYLLNGDTLGDGVWSRQDTNIYFHTGKVTVGTGSDTLVAPPGAFTVMAPTGIGITSYSIPDTEQVANTFIAELDNTVGHTGNFHIQTFSTGASNSVTHGTYSYIESDARATFASTSQAYYNGAGGSLGNLDNIPFVVGSGGDAFIEDTTAEAVAVGARNIAESEHQGINVGSYSSAFSENARMNIGSALVANTIDQYEMLDTTLLDVFPDRFTAGAFVYNHAADSTDYAIYAAGNAQNYLEGNVGIGTSVPTKKLDVAGAVNASAYYLNGDSLTFSGEGVWNESGGNIYYNAGSVSIGMEGTLPVDSTVLTVLGNVAMITDTQNFPVAFFSMGDSTGFLPDDDNDHSGIGFGITNSFEDSLAPHMGFKVSYDYEDSSLTSYWVYVDSSKLDMISIHGDFDNDEGGIVLVSMEGNDVEDWNHGSIMSINTEASFLMHGEQDSFGQAILMTDSVFLFGAYRNTPEIDELDSTATFIGTVIDTAKMWLGINGSEQGKIEINEDGVTIGKLLLDEGIDLTGNFTLRSDTAALPKSFFYMTEDSAANSGISPFPQSESARVQLGLIDTFGSVQDTQSVFFVMNKNNDDLYSHWGYAVESEKIGLISISTSNGDGGGINMFSGNENALSILKMSQHGLNLYYGEDVDSVGSYVKLDSNSITITAIGTDSTEVSINESGFGINTDSPDTELHVNGDTKQKIHSSNVSNPPTDAELDTLFTSPASKGDGWTAYVKDSNSDNLYQIMVVGTDWYIIGTTKAQ